MLPNEMKKTTTKIEEVRKRLHSKLDELIETSMIHFTEKGERDLTPSPQHSNQLQQ